MPLRSGTAFITYCDTGVPNFVSIAFHCFQGIFYMKSKKRDVLSIHIQVKAKLPYPGEHTVFEFMFKCPPHTILKTSRGSWLWHHSAVNGVYPSPPHLSEGDRRAAPSWEPHKNSPNVFLVHTNTFSVSFRSFAFHFPQGYLILYMLWKVNDDILLGRFQPMRPLDRVVIITKREKGDVFHTWYCQSLVEVVYVCM